MQYPWRHDVLSFPADSHGSIRKQRSQIAPRLFAAIGRTAPHAVRAAASVLLFAACLPFAAQAQTDTTPPAVMISAPASGATVSGTINLTANASDNVGVFVVRFFIDGTDFANEADWTAPPNRSFGVVWDTTTAHNGAHTIVAQACDSPRNCTSSDPVTVTVSNASGSTDITTPTVAITSPASGATVSGTTTIFTSASDNVGIVAEQIKIDGALYFELHFNPQVASPNSGFDWDTTTWSNGSHILTAFARDAAGNTTTSAPVTVTVSNSPPGPTDTTLPTVTITSPASGTTASGTISVDTSSSDNVGVVAVQFKLDGLTLWEFEAPTGASPPLGPSLRFRWDTTTASNGSHTLTAVARDAAGNAQTSAQIAVTVSNSAPITRTGPHFPRLGAYPIGNPHSYETAQFRDMALKYHVVIVSQWPGWQGGHGTLQFPTMASVMNDIRNRSTVGTKMFIYVNNDAISDPTASDDAYYPVWQKLNAESWWLYQNATTPPPVRSTFSNTQGTANNTNFGPSDAAGKNWIRWKADFDYGFNVVGDANNAPNPYVDGFFMDNVFWTPRVRGDWNRDGTTDCNGPSNFQPCNATEASWLRDGYKSYFDYIRSIWRPGTPGAGGLHAGNIADWGDPNANIVVYDQLLDGGVMEGMIGETWSVETQNGFISMMAWYRRMIDACRAPKLAIFGHDNWVSGNYQDMRYGLASTLMDDAYFYINASGGGYDPSNLLWFDEFNFDLGYPIQARQEAQWSQGVWRRDFDNGIVLVNPKGNPAQTVNLGGTFRKLTGTQDPATNNGATVTSVTLAERDGIILSR